MKTTKLKKLNACKEAIFYVQTQKSPAKAWNNCERGDWMLWLAKRMNVDDKKLTMAKAMCTKQVKHLMKNQRSKDALQACFDYANGKITKKELNIAAYAAAYDYAAAYADAAYAATYAADAAYAAAYFATNAADAATNVIANAARISSLKKSADICREYLTEEVLSKYRKLR